MDCTVETLSYEQTGFFSKLVLDFLNGADTLNPFYPYHPQDDAIKDVIEKRLHFKTDRELLSAALGVQYASVAISEKTKENLKLLQSEKTFSITTAHQPNIFTGPLYFIYKILHTVKLAAHCKSLFPDYDFVPVYYMGSEDADLDELGHLYLNQQKIVWDTRQTGAIGRMKVDTALLTIIDQIEAEIGVFTYGDEIVQLMRDCYQKDRSIQEATFKFVNALLGDWGVVVLIPDSALLKSRAISLFEDELLKGQSVHLINDTARALTEAGYKVQAHSRDINLFYLLDSGRHRIEKSNGKWKVLDTDLSFNEVEIIEELKEHPERFSPNVILRGIFQEMILPNIIFIGGGGELAYWVQLQRIFQHYEVPYPMLVLRNSFLFIPAKQQTAIQHLGIKTEQLFLTTHNLQRLFVTKNSEKKLSVTQGKAILERGYQSLKTQSALVNPTLTKHVAALQAIALKKIDQLEKKIIRAEKRNQEDAMRQIAAIKNRLFPFNSLQERIENFIPFYAKHGKGFLETLYKHSLNLKQQFVVLKEKN